MFNNIKVVFILLQKTLYNTFYNIYLEILPLIRFFLLI